MQTEYVMLGGGSMVAHNLDWLTPLRLFLFNFFLRKHNSESLNKSLKYVNNLRVLVYTTFIIDDHGIHE